MVSYVQHITSGQIQYAELPEENVCIVGKIRYNLVFPLMRKLINAISTDHLCVTFTK